MNKYLIRIANTEISAEGFDEYAALMSTALFPQGAIFVGAYKQTEVKEPNAFAWVYKVEVAGKIQLCVIERVFK